MRRRWALVASACFAGSAGAAVAFVVTYLAGASTQVTGSLVALAFAGVAAGLVLWASRLLPDDTHVEARDPMPSPVQSRAAVAEETRRGSGEETGILRRSLVLASMGLAAAVVAPVRSLLPPGEEEPEVALARTAWRRGVRLVTGEGDPVRAADLEAGMSLTVFPEVAPDADDATAVLVCLDRGDVVSGSGELDGTRVAVLAFSKLCTHAGCPVALYQQTTRQLLCPCHQAVFDVRDGARPVAGPAARPLPALPLAVDRDGYVVAAGDFEGPVGPTYWREG